MAGDELVGNMDTGALLRFLGQRGCDTGIDPSAFRRATELADSLFRTNENPD